MVTAYGKYQSVMDDTMELLDLDNILGRIRIV